MHGVRLWSHAAQTRRRRTKLESFEVADSLVPGQQMEWAEKNATVLYRIVVQVYNGVMNYQQYCNLDAHRV